MYCKALQKIVIPDSVTSIGIGAFKDCRDLQEIVLPKSLAIDDADIVSQSYPCKVIRK